MSDATGLHLELLDLLLFEPQKAQRVPVSARAVGESLRLLCPTCRLHPVGGSAIPTVEVTIPTVTLVCYQHRSGLVWVGRCALCGLVLYTTKKGGS